jgi:hypothetical protein
MKTLFSLLLLFLFVSCEPLQYANGLGQIIGQAETINSRSGLDSYFSTGEIITVDFEFVDYENRQIYQVLSLEYFDARDRVIACERKQDQAGLLSGIRCDLLFEDDNDAVIANLNALDAQDNVCIFRKSSLTGGANIVFAGFFENHQMHEYSIDCENRSLNNLNVELEIVRTGSFVDQEGANSVVFDLYRSGGVNVEVVLGADPIVMTDLNFGEEIKLVPEVALDDIVCTTNYKRGLVEVVNEGMWEIVSRNAKIEIECNERNAPSVESADIVIKRQGSDSGDLWVNYSIRNHDDELIGSRSIELKEIDAEHIIDIGAQEIFVGFDLSLSIQEEEEGLNCTVDFYDAENNHFARVEDSNSFREIIVTDAEIIITCGELTEPNPMGALSIIYDDLESAALGDDESVLVSLSNEDLGVELNYELNGSTLRLENIELPVGQNYLISVQTASNRLDCYANRADITIDGSSQVMITCDDTSAGDEGAYTHLIVERFDSNANITSNIAYKVTQTVNGGGVLSSSVLNDKDSLIALDGPQTSTVYLSFSSSERLTCTLWKKLTPSSNWQIHFSNYNTNYNSRIPIGAGNNMQFRLVCPTGGPQEQ